MTPDERKMLTDLANKLAQTPAPPRDPEAEEFIRTRIGNRPDALYMMTQTVLVQNIALQRAQQQLEDSQRAGQSAASGASFLGGAVPQSAARPQYSGPSPAPQYAAPAAAPAGGGGGGGSSFLRGAAQTAAGVAAGTLAADAIGSLFHGFGGGGLGGGFLGGGERPVEEVVNNYYDTPPNDYQANAGSDYQNADYQNVDDTQVDNSQPYDDGSDLGGGFDDGSGGDFNV